MRDQQRLWLTEPRRRTCLAEVIDARGPWFAVDRALFTPRTSTCRHPQVPDKGVVWVEGDKRKLGGVKDEGMVWYRLRGTVPEVGTRLQCGLDATTRDAAAASHTAMHLFLAAATHADAPPLIADPEVKGGGTFRLTFERPVEPTTIARILQRTQAWVEADVPVERAFATRAEAEHRATPQAFRPPDPVPGPDPMPLVTVGDVCYPCDGSHVDRTGDVGTLVVTHAHTGKAGFVVVGKRRD